MIQYQPPVGLKSNTTFDQVVVWVGLHAQSSHVARGPGLTQCKHVCAYGVRIGTVCLPSAVLCTAFVRGTANASLHTHAVGVGVALWLFLLMGLLPQVRGQQDAREGLSHTCSCFFCRLQSMSRWTCMRLNAADEQLSASAQRQGDTVRRHITTVPVVVPSNNQNI